MDLDPRHRGAEGTATRVDFQALTTRAQVPDGAEVAAGTREVPHWPEPEPELEPELEPEVDIFSTQQKSKACHCR